MKTLIWFQALAFAKLQGRAIRREGWQRWIVYRHYGWYSVEWSAGAEAWRPVLNRDLTKADYEAHDWTTMPWENGPLPACCPTDQPARQAGNATGGSQSWGPRENCGGLALAISGGPTGGGAGGPARPVLDSWSIRTRAEVAPFSSGIAMGMLSGGGPLGFTRFPPGYSGAVEAVFNFSPGERAIRGYVWLQTEDAPTGNMEAPFDFAVDGISKLEGAFGPVRPYPRAGGAGTTPADSLAVYQAGYVFENDPDSGAGLGSEGQPAGALAHLPLQPGTFINARIDLVHPAGPRWSYLVSRTLPGWVREPVVITFVTVYTPEPGGTYPTPGLDGIIDTEDDETAACYTGSGPSVVALAVTVTVTGGKAGTDGTLQLKIDGVVVSTLVGRSTAFTTETMPYVSGEEHTCEARWTQPEDEYGPAWDATESTTVAMSPLCP